MNIELGKLFGMQAALNTLVGMPLEAKTSYRVSRMLKKIISELKDLDAERIKLVNKYGEKDDKGNTQVKPENIEKFNKDWAALLEMETELDSPKIPFSMIETLKISARDMLALEDIIEGPSDDSERAQ